MQDTINNDVTPVLVEELLAEKRADRRWKNIRSLAWLAFFTYMLFGVFSIAGKSSAPLSGTGSKYAALVRLDGMIAPGRDTSAMDLVPVLEQAFSDKNAEGVVIDINSPGGTPVQAAIIHDAIIAFKHKYKKKVIIVGEDMLTSGAYYVAVAGDKIYVNPNTLTGSVGVIMSGFGFTDLLQKVGVERRVYTSGDSKDRLDPFLPVKPEDVVKVKEVMSQVHFNFEQAVLSGRKGKIKGDPQLLFNGDFWSGQRAVELGLVDATGNLMEVMDKEFHTIRFKEYSNSSSLAHLLGNGFSSAVDHVRFGF